MKHEARVPDSFTQRWQDQFVVNMLGLTRIPGMVSHDVLHVLDARRRDIRAMRRRGLTRVEEILEECGATL